MAINQIVTSVTVLSSGLIGYNAISLTNFTVSALSSIASGSAVEVAGTFFKCDSDTTIDSSSWGAIASASNCYIALEVSGTAGSQVITPYFTSIAPVWVASKNGYYATAGSSVRVVGGVYKGTATSQENKFLYRGLDTSLKFYGINLNTAFGYEANNSMVSGNYNTAIGRSSLASGTGVNYDTAIGHGSMYLNTSGTSNTAIGANSLFNTTSGSNIVAVGKDAGYNNLSGSNNVYIGYQAGYTATAGSLITYIGYKSGYAHTSGVANTAVGANSLLSNTSGGYNTAVGNSSLQSVTTKSMNTAVGVGSLYYNTASSNTAVGAYSLFNNNGGDDNIAIGVNSLYTATNSLYNVAIGNSALYACVASTSNSCTFNTAVGYSALSSYVESVSGLVPGKNTALGGQAGSSLIRGDNNIIIGYNAQASATAVSNEITLGNSENTVLRCNASTITALSDARDKTDITDSFIGLSFVNDLKSRIFYWDRREWYENNVSDGSKKQGVPTLGMIAQEVDEVQKKHNAEFLNLVYKSNPDRLELDKGEKLIPILVKAIQELSSKYDALEANYNTLLSLFNNDGK